MNVLFFFLLLFSIVSLVAGLIKPSWFNRLFKGNSTRKKVGISFGIATFLFFILFGAVSPKTSTTQSSSNQNKTADIQQQQTTTTQPQPTPPSEPTKTPEQNFEDQIKPLVKNIGSSDFTYKGLDWSNSDTAKDSKIVTIKVSVDDFLSKDYLIRNTGTLSSNLIEQSFKSNLPIADVIVWYYGKVKDQYGNEKEDIIMSYAITKTTSLKINWGGFDKNGLCDFLKTQTDEDVCVVRVNIK